MLKNTEERKQNRDIEYMKSRNNRKITNKLDTLRINKSQIDDIPDAPPKSNNPSLDLAYDY